MKSHYGAVLNRKPVPKATAAKEIYPVSQAGDFLSSQFRSPLSDIRRILIFRKSGCSERIIMIWESMFRQKKEITVKVKLFGGLDKSVQGYDPDSGIAVGLPEGARLRHLVKKLRLPDSRSLAYFIRGERVGLQTKLSDHDEIACLRPLAGG